MDLQPRPPEPVAAGPRPGHLSVVPPSGSRSSTPSPDMLAGWVRAVAQGDREAFGLLFAHFAPRIKSYLLRAGTDDALAEDLAQETMVLVWRKAALFDAAHAGASTWVFTIARNLRVDRFRRQGGAGALQQVDDVDPDGLAHGAPEPAVQLHAQRMERHVQAALRQLPPEQAMVLQLSYYEDQPHARIAERLGIPLGTVKSRVRLAVAHLRRLLAAFEEPQP